MKNRHGKTGSTPRHKSPAGFSLVELTVAMAVFLVVGGAAVALVKMHVPLFTSQQNQTGLNLSLRNGVASGRRSSRTSARRRGSSSDARRGWLSIQGSTPRDGHGSKPSTTFARSIRGLACNTTKYRRA